MSGQKLPKGIYIRPNGLYMGCICYKGERHSLYDRNLNELQKKMTDLRYELQHGFYVKETNLTMDDWFNTWLEDYKKDSVKYGTYSLYQRSYRLYIQKPLGKMKLSEVRPDHIQHLYNTMSRANYNQQTINIVANIVYGMLKQAVKNQLIPRNAAEAATKPKKQKKKEELRIMSQEEQKLFLHYAAQSLYYRVYVVALGTGMRCGELRALEWSDIDFKNRIIHVTGTLKFHSGEGYVKDTPKTAASDRKIPMLEEVYKILKEQRRKQQEMRLQVAEFWQPRPGLENLVFTSEYGRKGYGIPIGEGSLNNDLKRIVQRINEDGYEFTAITPHSLRHTFATRGLENGIPPKVMQDLLGHTSITMTLDIYSHVLPDTKEIEMQKIANMF